MSTDMRMRVAQAFPFADNEDFLQTQYDQVRLQIRCAGLRRHLERWELDGPGDGKKSHGQLTHDLDLSEREYLRLQAQVDSRLGISDPIDIPWTRLVEQCALDTVAQQILWLLFFAAVLPDFRELLHHWELDEAGSRSDRELNVATLLQILRPGPFSKQMEVRKHFSMDAPLVAQHLIKLDDFAARTSSILAVDVEIDPRIIAWISGDDNRYVGESFLHIERPQNALDQVVLPNETLQQVLSLLTQYDRYKDKRVQLGLDQIITYGRGICLLEYGPPGTGKTLLAHALAHHTGRPLVSLRIGQIHHAGRYWSEEEALEALFREAQLLGGIVFIDECDRLCAAKSEFLSHMLIELERTDAIVIMATNRPEELAPELDRRFTLKIPFALPDAGARQRIWQTHLRQVPLQDDVDLEHLAHSYPLAGGYIKNAVLAAINTALARTMEHEGDFQLNQQDLDQASRMQEKHIGGMNLYRRIVHAQGRLSDLTVSPQDRSHLEHLYRMLHNYRTVVRRWNVRHEQGIRVLLSGSSIEMLQEVVGALAGELNTSVELVSLPDLINLSNDDVKGVSLQQMNIFHAVSGTGHLLVFQDDQHLLENLTDEEDNPDCIAFFNQLAAFKGAALIITTARRVRLPFGDALFQRRIAISEPDAESRKALWHKTLGGDAHLGADVDIDYLAMHYELSWDQVREAVHQACLMEAEREEAGSGALSQELLETAIGQVRTQRVEPLFGAQGIKGAKYER